MFCWEMGDDFEKGVATKRAIAPVDNHGDIPVMADEVKMDPARNLRREMRDCFRGILMPAIVA